MKFIFKPKWRRFTSAVQIPLTIVLVAFALRVATIVAEHTYQVPIRGRGWYFAYEMGAIAGSVASGRGFRSPFCAACGPTAWVGPIYPLLLAGIFKVFGAYTNLSAFVSLAVNSIFGAVNALVIFHIARDIFDRARCSHFRLDMGRASLCDLLAYPLDLGYQPFGTTAERCLFMDATLGGRDGQGKMV